MTSSSTKTVVVVFSDNTLGGTSRSALQAGLCWKYLGYLVEFRAVRGVHRDRTSAFEQVGTVIRNLIDPLPSSPDLLIHYHHGGWSSSQKETYNSLLSLAKRRSTPPALLTNNVFAVRDLLTQTWPGPSAASVLGYWARQQYIVSLGTSGQGRRIAVVPNAQDEQFFRPPTTTERLAARRRLGLEENRLVLLRVGSPHMTKWSFSYARLARRVPNATLLLVGAPAALVDSMQGAANVVCHSPVADDEVLRDYYWASDRFVHDAQRGESFGNVIFEALLCGIPVVYRARKLRDNTPWELSALEGFWYTESDVEWANASAREDGEARRHTVTALDRSALVNSYSLTAVAARLANIARELLLADGTETNPSSDEHSLAPRDKFLVWVLHNPAVALVKQWRIGRV